eukprot:scaffold13257_cov164-Skeletonema_menzelii.AAC.1
MHRGLPRLLFMGLLKKIISCRTALFLGNCMQRNVSDSLHTNTTKAPSGVGHDLHDASNGLYLLLHMAALVVSVILDVVMAAIIIDSFGPNGSYMSTFFSHNDALIHIVGLLL